MLDFIKKYKDELKKPGMYILIAIFIFAVGYKSGNINAPIIMFGGGTLMFAIRDIIALIGKEKDLF